jgi:acetyl-CoA C-acetyltransferase
VTVDARAPLLVGVGVAVGDGATEAAELMAQAVEAAARDTGTAGMLQATDRIAVPQGSWAYADPARFVADRVGAGHARTHLIDIGIPQQTLINAALRAIADGESEVAIVVGGEAKRRAQLAEREGRSAPDTEQPGVTPDVHDRPHGELLAPPEINARIWNPVEQYALIENALRHAEDLSVAEHRAQIAALWARCNQIAAGNPHAAFPTPMTADEIATASPKNRPLAFPYNKWHSTQWTVDQSAALLFCSWEAAERYGVPIDRRVFPRVALDSSLAVSLSRRRQMHAWPAMTVLGDAAAQRIGRPLDEVEHVDLYSCFPSAVRVQQRALGLPRDGTPTITGGMAFAGGPFNNYVLQSTAAMADRLRAAPGELGLVTTVSGLLTKPGLAVWSTAPGDEPLVGDFADEARAATDTVEVVDAHEGDATVASYTVTYADGAPSRLVMIADLEDGSRCIAVGDDPALAARGLEEELIGTRIGVRGGVLVA